MHFIHAKRLSGFCRNLGIVTGYDDGLQSALFQSRHSVLRIGLQPVLQNDAAFINTVLCDIDHGSRIIFFLEFDSEIMHHPAVSRKDHIVFDSYLNTASGNLIDVVDICRIDFFTACRTDACRNRMIGGGFRICRILQNRFTVKRRTDFADLKHAFRQRAGLIEHGSLCACQRFHHICAFDKNTLFGKTADSRKEGQRHRDDKRTWAGDDKERAGTIDSCIYILCHNRDDDCDRDRREYNRRRIDP